MSIEQTENDIFIIHGYGDRDKQPVFLRVDENGKFNFSKFRSIASEFTRDEARDIIADGEKKRRLVYAIRVIPWIENEKE